MPDSATLPTPPEEPRDPAVVNPHYEIRYPPLSRWRRMQIPVIGWAGYALASALGPTLRYEVLGWQNVQGIWDSGQRTIMAFWHRCIFAATWWWRHRGIVVMNTTNFDWQWTRRVIDRLGYGTAQGSSSRGGLRGLAVMARRLKEGRDVAFTIDGPRGPRYVAKPGPVMLARRTGCPVTAFHIGVESAHTFEKAWDLFQLPRPFSRGVIFIAPPIYVSAEADADEMERKHAEMQAALERVRDLAESWFTLTPEERDRARAAWNR